jgi:hypothetical protein
VGQKPNKVGLRQAAAGHVEGRDTLRVGTPIFETQFMSPLERGSLPGRGRLRRGGRRSSERDAMRSCPRLFFVEGNEVMDGALESGEGDGGDLDRVHTCRDVVLHGAVFLAVRVGGVQRATWLGWLRTLVSIPATSMRERRIQAHVFTLPDRLSLALSCRRPCTRPALRAFLKASRETFLGMFKRWARMRTSLIMSGDVGGLGVFLAEVEDGAERLLVHICQIQLVLALSFSLKPGTLASMEGRTVDTLSRSAIL